MANSYLYIKTEDNSVWGYGPKYELKYNMNAFPNSTNVSLREGEVPFVYFATKENELVVINHSHIAPLYPTGKTDADFVSTSGGPFTGSGYIIIDGVNDNLFTAYGLSNSTLCFWVKFVDSTSCLRFEKDSEIMTLTSTQFTHSKAATTSVSIGTGVWHYVALVCASLYDGINIYVDGSKVATASGTTSDLLMDIAPKKITSTGSPVYIYDYVGDLYRLFSGNFSLPTQRLVTEQY